MTSLKTTVFNSNSNSIVSSIHGGELSGNTDICRIERSLEDKFLDKHEYFDYPLPASVLSTIAIAISSDGFLVATTHGDHTVKVFWYEDCKTYRIFRGHPRTPWTVKFHSTDSNILASGCLGFEVRVWDIEQDACVALSRYDYSIISLAFHPVGDIIGVATGPKLHMWRWKESVYPSHVGRYPPNSQKIANGRDLRVLLHSRNIRAVLFHPDGDYIFAAAPDAPRQSTPAFTPCRLYAFTFDDIAVPSSWDSDEEDEETPQPQPQQQPQPQPQQQPPAPPRELKLCDIQDLIPQAHLYSDGGIDLSADGRYILTCAKLLLEPISPTQHDDKQQERQMSPMYGNSSPQSPKEAHDAPLPPASSSLLLQKPTGHSLENIHSGENPGGLHLNENLFSKNLRFDSELEIYDPIRRFDNSTKLHTSSSSSSSSSSSLKGGRKYIFADPRKDNLEKDFTEWISEDHLCLVKLDLMANTSNRAIPFIVSTGYPGSFMRPTVARSLPLTPPLVKAVTSTKLSPTGRYALVGYGVRSDGEVEDHPQSDVACEVINLFNMETVTIMPDNEDEVNIAQFHPIPGMGVLYGTKKGKVRTFRGN